MLTKFSRYSLYRLAVWLFYVSPRVFGRPAKPWGREVTERLFKRVACSLTIAFLTCYGVAAKAEYPTAPVRFVVAFPAGGGLDMTARLLAQKLSEYWKQPVVVDNRPGASGMIGAGAVARSANDGYTLLIGSPAEIAINPALYPKMAYDPFKDLAPISPVAKFPLLVVANTRSSLKSFKDLVAQSRDAKDGVAFATSGIGSMQQLVGEWLKRNADTNLLHVPYKGTGPAMNDLLGGQIPVAVMGLAPLIPHIKAGNLRALAITSSERNPAVPNVPTLKELGYDFESTIWFGVFAPEGTPKEVIRKIGQDLRVVLADKGVEEQMLKLGGETASSSPGEFTSFISDEFAKYSKIIKDANIKM